jgi:hypothetical protein
MNATSLNTREPNNPKAAHTFPGPLDQLHWTPYGHARRGCGSELRYAPKRLNKGPLSLLTPRPCAAEETSPERGEGVRDTRAWTREPEGTADSVSAIPLAWPPVMKSTRSRWKTYQLPVPMKISSPSREGTRLTYQITAWIPPHNSKTRSASA